MKIDENICTLYNLDYWRRHPTAVFLMASSQNGHSTNRLSYSPDMYIVHRFCVIPVVGLSLHRSQLFRLCVQLFIRNLLLFRKWQKNHKTGNKISIWPICWVMQTRICDAAVVKPTAIELEPKNFFPLLISYLMTNKLIKANNNNPFMYF